MITYRDGVATFPGYFTAEPYYDIARVEILRGPQGTFVGQNATGGAVFVTSQDPIINGGHTATSRRRSATTTTSARRARSIYRSATRSRRASHSTARQRDSFYDIAGPYTGDDGVQTGSVRLGMLWEPSDESLDRCFKTDYNYLDLSAAIRPIR